MSATNPKYIPNQVRNGIQDSESAVALVAPGDKVVVEQWSRSSYGSVRRLQKGIVKKVNAKTITVDLREVCKRTGAVRFVSKPTPTQYIWRQDWAD
jgi:hypothetical protein